MGEGTTENFILGSQRNCSKIQFESRNRFLGSRDRGFSSKPFPPGSLTSMDFIPSRLFSALLVPGVSTIDSI